MAKIGIYNEPSAGGLGGSEYAIAVLAEELAKVHEVEIVHHRSTLKLSELAEFSATDLNRVRLRYVEPEDYEPVFAKNLWRRYAHARAWRQALSQPYQIFVCSGHGVPPFCQAAKGVLFVLFPFELPPGIDSNDAKSIWPRRVMSQTYYRWEWKRRMASYGLKTAISDFTRRWAALRWDIECEIVYVPVDTNFKVAPKTKTILSAGRFALPGEGHEKKQKEMLDAFLELRRRAITDWSYLSVGTLANTVKHLSWFETLRQAAAGHNAEFKTNLTRQQLKQTFETAGIFWHAAGYGEDEDLHPELTEHFGIVTVEAMAAGCVPVVIRKGGQSEIVQHGISGYLWDTVDELIEYTDRLIKDAALRERMSDAARLRAQCFSREVFIKRFLKLLQPLLPD